MGATKITADVANADEPIQLADAKKHLRVDDFGGSHPDDAYIRDVLIPAARQYAEHYCDRSFAKRTAQYILDAFPSCPSEGVRVELAPIGALTSVAYRDASDSAATLLAANVYVEPGESRDIYLTPAAQTTGWPLTSARKGNVVLAYDTAAGCPQAVRSAMLLIVGHMYENRSESITGTIITALPLGVKALLDTASWSHV